MKNRFVVSTHSCRILVILLVAIVCLGATFCAPPKYAEASVATESVSHDQIVARNPLVIMSAKTMKETLGKDPQKAEVVSKGSSEIKTTYATKATGLSNSACRAKITEYRKGLIAEAAAEWDKGWVIEFPSCNSQGATGSVTVKYPIVGTYEGREIGALATYMVTRAANNLLPSWDWDTGEYDYSYSAMQISDSLFGGQDLRNTKSVDVDISFFYTDNNSTVTLNENSMFTVGSLNWYDNARTSGIGNAQTGNFGEWVYADDSCTTKFQVPSSTDSGTLGNINVSSFESGTIGFGYRNDNWKDDITSSDFYRQSVSVFQSGTSFKFRVGSNFDLSAKNTAMANGIWWSISGASTATMKPLAPTKMVDKKHASVGDILTYTAAQEVHASGIDIQSKYTSFKFVDSLPSEVAYVNDSAKMYRVTTSGTKTDITTTAGSFSYDSSKNTLTFIFKSDFLTNMLMDNETYQMVFDAQINSTAQAGKDFINVVEVAINEFSQVAEATTNIISPLDPVKTVDQESAQVGENVTYKVDQKVFDEEQYIGKFNDMQFFDYLPKEIDYIEDSAQMYCVTSDGTETNITTTAGAFLYDPTEHTLTYSFNTEYLNSMFMGGEVYRLVFEATINERAEIDSPIVNKAVVAINGTGQEASVLTMPYKDKVETIEPNDLENDKAQPQANGSANSKPHPQTGDLTGIYFIIAIAVLLGATLLLCIYRIYRQLSSRL